MALDNYTNLQATIARWLNRDDLTTDIPDFITLCEQTLRRELKRRTLTQAITLDSGTVTLPSDVEEVVALSLDTDSYHGPLDLTTIVGVRDHLERYSPTGLPRVYAVLDNTLRLAPVPDTSYTGVIVYREKLVSLSGSNPSNATLVRAPDAYLYGALLEAALFLEHDERAPIWKAKFDEAIDAENLQREKEELGAAPIAPRLPVVFGED